MIYGGALHQSMDMKQHELETNTDVALQHEEDRINHIGIMLARSTQMRSVLSDARSSWLFKIQKHTHTQIYKLTK